MSASVRTLIDSAADSRNNAQAMLAGQSGTEAIVFALVSIADSMLAIALLLEAHAPATPAGTEET